MTRRNWNKIIREQKTRVYSLGQELRSLVCSPVVDKERYETKKVEYEKAETDLQDMYKIRIARSVEGYNRRVDRAAAKAEQMHNM